MPSKGNFHILYGSQTGQAEEIAKQIHEEAVYKNYEAEVFCLQDEGKSYTIADIKCAVFVCSTTGDGDPPENARKFVYSLRRKTHSDNYLAHLSYALLGLGDTNYSTFCGGPKKLEKVLKARGATSFFKTAFADDATDMEEVVEPWIDGLFSAVEKYFSTFSKSLHNSSKEIISEMSNGLSSPNDSASNVTDAIANSFNGLSVIEKDEETVDGDLTRADQVCNGAKEDVRTPTSNKDNVNYSELCIPLVVNNPLLHNFTLSESKLTIPPLPQAYLDLKFLANKSIDLENIPYQNAAVFPLAISKIIKAQISNGRQLTRDDALKKSLEIQLSLKESYPYEPGDSLGICCENDIKEVNWLINRLSLETVDNVPAQLNVKDGTSKKSAAVPSYIPAVFTVRYVLQRCLEIRAVPKKPFVRALVDCTSDLKEKRRLQELCSREGALDYSQKVREPSICILDLLSILPSCKPSLELLVQHLPRLKPRRYSITTSPLNNPNIVKFVFNVVKFDADHGRIFARKGVCTGYLEKLFKTLKNPTSEIDIFLTKSTGFRLPVENTTPIVLIGPGTGVAPFIGFLEHRRMLGGFMGEAWLFYGCRHKDRDFLYQTELEAFEREGILTKLVVAFSRDLPTSENGNAKYVQDNLRLHSTAVIDLLLNKGAVFYVCGDARNMAKDTRQCLIDLIATETNCDRNDAEGKFKQVSSEHRYREDIWT